MALPLSYFILSLSSPTFFFFFLSPASLSLFVFSFFVSFFLSLVLFLVLSFFLSLVQPSSTATTKARASKHQDHDRQCWVLILSDQVMSLSNPKIKLCLRIGLSLGQIMRPDASHRLEDSPTNWTKPRPEIKLH